MSAPRKRRSVTAWCWPRTREVRVARAMLPCPFCGGVDVFVNESTPGTMTGGKGECHGCGANGPWRYGNRLTGPQRAVAAWNRRTLPAPRKQARP
jgi:Lar family restriction alleviation protein